MEEAQHAKLDTLVVEALAEGRSDAEIAHGVDEYLAIGAFIDGGLKQQVEFDLEAFQRATGRKLTAKELERARVVQLQGSRWTYLGSGMTHPVARLRAARADRGGGQRSADLTGGYPGLATGG